MNKRAVIRLGCLAACGLVLAGCGRGRQDDDRAAAPGPGAPEARAKSPPDTPRKPEPAPPPDPGPRPKKTEPNAPEPAPPGPAPAPVPGYRTFPSPVPLELCLASDDAGFVVGVGRDRTLVTWRFDAGGEAPARQLGRVKDFAFHMSLLPDNKHLVVTHTGGRDLFRIDPPEVVWRVGGKSMIRSVASPDGKLLYCGHHHGMFVTDAASGKELASVGFPFYGLSEMGWADPGKTIYVSNPAGVHHFDVATRKVVPHLAARPADAPYRTSGVSPNGRWYVGDAPTGMEVWDVGKKVKVASWANPLTALAPVAVSNDGRFVALPDGRRGMQILDAATGEVRRRYDAAPMSAQNVPHQAGTARRMFLRGGRNYDVLVAVDWPD